MSKYKYIYLFILLGFNIYSQDILKKHYLSTSFKTGVVLKHKDTIDYLNSSLYSFDIKYYLNTNDITFLNKNYNFPKYGFGTGFTFFSNNILKGMQTLYATIKVPLYTSNSINFNFSSDVGIAYNFNPFDEQKNPKNFMIGAMFGAYVSVFSDIEYKINDNFSTSIGLGFFHNSNGGTKYPNLGLNAGYANFEIIYKIKENEITLSESILTIKENELLLNTYFGIINKPLKEDGTTNKNLFPVFGISLEYIFRISTIIKMGTGLDIIYKDIQHDESETNKEFKNTNRNILLGTKIPFELILGRTSLLLDVGIFILKNDESYVYNRLGLKFRLTDNLHPFVKVCASSYFTAYYLEYGLYYSIL